MFGDINEVNILGRVTQDVEVKHSQGGLAILNFSVATSRSYKDSNDEWVQDTDFHNIAMFGKYAETIGAKIQKGTRLHIQGRLKTDSWETEGVKKYKTSVIASKVILLDKYKDKDSGKSTSSRPQKSRPQQSQSQPGNEVIDPDDLPF